MNNDAHGQAASLAGFSGAVIAPDPWISTTSFSE
jgi:hypothetical protein